MKQIVHPSNQKFVIVVLAVAASFFGFEAAGRAIDAYQLRNFFEISLYVYLFLLFMQIFVFDLHLRPARSIAGLERSFFAALRNRFHYMGERNHFLHFQNYLILPGVIYWATIAILFLNPFAETIKQTWITLSSLALGLSFWYLKTVFYAHHDAARTVRKAIFMAKLYASYLAFAAAFGITRYFAPVSPESIALSPVAHADKFALGSPWLFVFIFSISFLLFYQALFQHHAVDFNMLKFLFFTSIGLGVLGYFLFYYWNANYFSGALVLTAVYNTIWGIVHHKYIDKNLTRDLVYEYLAVLFVILVILIGSTNFGERI